MFYLIVQVLQLLLIATALGVLLGWVLRKIKASKIEEKLKSRIHQSEDTIQPIKQALSDAQSEVETRDKSIAQLQAKLTDFDDQIVPPIKAEIAQLMGKLGESSNSVDGLKRDVNDKDNQLQKLSNDLSLEKAAVRQVDQALADAHGKRAELENRLAEARVRLENNDTATQRAKADSAALQREINALQINLNDSLHKRDATIAHLQRDLELETREHAKVAATLATAEADKAKTEQKIDALKQQLHDKITDHKLALSEKAALQREIDALQAQLDREQKTHDDKVTGLENALTARQLMADEANLKLTDNAGSIAKLEGELERAKDKLGELASKDKGGNSARAALQEEIAKLSKEKAQLEQSNRDIAGKAEKDTDKHEAIVGALRKELSVSDAEKSAIASDKEKALEKLEANKSTETRQAKDQSRLEHKIGLLEAKIKAQDKETAQKNADLEKQLAQKEGSRQSGETRQQQMEEKIQALKDELNEKITDSKLASTLRNTLEKDIAALEEEVDKLNAQAEALQKSLEQSKDEHTNTINELKAALADKEVRAADGGLAIKKLADLTRDQEKNDKAQLQAMRQAEQKIAELDRNLGERDEKLANLNREAKKLEGEFAKTNQQNQQLREKLELATEQQRDQATELKIANSEKDKARQDVANSENNAQKALTAAEKTVAGLEHKKASLDSELQSIRDGLAELKTSAKVTQAEKAALERELQKTKDTSAEEIASLKAEAKKLQGEHARVTQQCKSLEEKLNAATQQEQSRAMELKLANTNNDNAVKQALAAAQKNAGKLANAEKHTAKLEQQIAEITGELNGVKESAAEQRSGANVTAAEKAAADREVQSLKGEIAKIELARDKNIEALQKELATTNAAAHLAEKNAASYRDGLETLKKSNQDNSGADSKKIEALDKQLAQEVAEKSRLTGELGKKENELASALSDVKELRTEGKHAAQEGKNLEKQADKLDAAYSALKKDLEKVTETARQHLDSSKRAEQENAELKRTLDAREKELGLLTGKLPSLESDLRNKDKNESRLEREISELKSRLNSLNETMGGLEKDLATRETANAGLDAANNDMQAQLADYQSLESELLSRIRELESLLTTARKDAGKNLLSRIMELEAMLEAERSKADEFRTMIGLTDATVSTSSIKKVAANSELGSKKKTS